MTDTVDIEHLTHDKVVQYRLRGERDFADILVKAHVRYMVRARKNDLRKIEDEL